MLFSTFKWKNSWNKRNVWKGIRVFSCWKIPGRNLDFMSSNPFSNISLRLSRTFFVERNWLRQMVNAITRNGIKINQSWILSTKPWSDRFTHVNSRKALCPKACDTASSHCYLPLGTFRQRAVRGGCICFCHTDFYKMQYFTIFQDKLHSFNIQDHRSTRGLLVKLLQFKKFPKSPIRPAGSNFWHRQICEEILKELRFNVIENLLSSIF